jgi:hypothetical protein
MRHDDRRRPCPYTAITSSPLVGLLGDPKPIREVRERIVHLAEGKVLEIGVGPGVNFVHYNPARVSKVRSNPTPG